MCQIDRNLSAIQDLLTSSGAVLEIRYETGLGWGYKIYGKYVLHGGSPDYGELLQEIEAVLLVKGVGEL